MARTQRDWIGSAVGMLVFLGGIALLVLTFKLAYTLFTVPPDQALKLNSQKTIDLAVTGGMLGTVLVRGLLLIVMCVVSSLIANRGIHLYSQSLIRNIE